MGTKVGRSCLKLTKSSTFQISRTHPHDGTFPLLQQFDIEAMEVPCHYIIPNFPTYKNQGENSKLRNNLYPGGPSDYENLFSSGIIYYIDLSPRVLDAQDRAPQRKMSIWPRLWRPVLFPHWKDYLMRFRRSGTFIISQWHHHTAKLATRHN